MAEKCKKSSGKKKEISIRIGVTYRNKVKALVRHLKRFPEDTQASVALETLKRKGTITPRQAPKRPIWKDSTVYLAKLATQAGYRGDAVLSWSLRTEKNPVDAYLGWKNFYAKKRKAARLEKEGRLEEAAAVSAAADAKAAELSSK